MRISPDKLKEALNAGIFSELDVYAICASLEIAGREWTADDAHQFGRKTGEIILRENCNHAPLCDNLIEHAQLARARVRQQKHKSLALDIAKGQNTGR